MFNINLLPTCFQLRSRCKLVTGASDLYRYKRAERYLFPQWKSPGRRWVLNVEATTTKKGQHGLRFRGIIPHVILQMAGGYKFWSGRFLKFASKPTRAESLLIVRLYIHGISVRFGVAVLAFCKKGFLNFAEFWNSLPNPHGASCFVLYAYLWLRRINRVKNIVNTMNSFQPDGLYATSPVARDWFEAMQFTKTLSDLCHTRQRRAIRWCSNALIQLIFYA